MDINAVKEFFNHYHTKVLVRPELYLSGPHSVDIILPTVLIEYANAAAGHTGFGSGARARGIRRETRNSHVTREEIFETIDSLIAFLESSEMDYESCQNPNGKKTVRKPKKPTLDANGALKQVVNEGEYDPKLTTNMFEIKRLVAKINSKRPNSNNEYLEYAEEVLEAFKI